MNPAQVPPSRQYAGECRRNRMVQSRSHRCGASFYFCSSIQLVSIDFLLSTENAISLLFFPESHSPQSRKQIFLCELSFNLFECAFVRVCFQLTFAWNTYTYCDFIFLIYLFQVLTFVCTSFPSQWKCFIDNVPMDISWARYVECQGYVGWKRFIYECGQEELV